MTVNIDKIYRVIHSDNYQHVEPETCWTKNKNACKEYIEKCYYKHCLSIEESTLCDETPLKIR